MHKGGDQGLPAEASAQAGAGQDYSILTHVLVNNHKEDKFLEPNKYE